MTQPVEPVTPSTEAAEDRSRWPPAWIVDDPVPRSGQFNMAFDAALLALGADRDFSVVRVYEWAEPTVSMGYFQPLHPGRRAGAGHSTAGTDGQDDTRWAGLPFVRRLSGGGAILHDREITYSFVIPANHPVASNPSSLYRRVHQALIGLLQECGVTAFLRCDADRARGACRTSPPDSPFLCFLREDGNDIVHQQGPKIVGSAQRRRRQVVLQHGSILLQSSPIAPDIPGILDLTPGFLSGRFRGLVGDVVAEALATESRRRDVLVEETRLIERQLAADTDEEMGRTG